MTIYTVEIQAGNADETIWQAVHPAENLDINTWWGSANFTPYDIAQDIAETQNIADDGVWRVCVWLGADADTGHTPAATFYGHELRK